MSKRTRGGQRPGQRRPTARPAGTRPPDTTRRPPAASAVGPDAAPDTIIEMTADDAPLERPQTTSPPVGRHARARAKPGSLLAARAATEYVYVGQDLRRIVWTVVLLFGIMVLLWVLLVVLRLSPLY